MIEYQRGYILYGRRGFGMAIHIQQIAVVVLVFALGVLVGALT